MSEARRPLTAWILGGVATILVLGALGAYLALVTPLRSRRARLQGELDAAARDFHQQVWRRPVLRGEAREGNAYLAQVAALERFGREFHQEDAYRIRHEVEEGGLPSEETLAEVVAWQDTLDELRASTQYDHAWADYPAELGNDVPDHGLQPQLRVATLLISAAAAEEPAECLRIGADVIRMSQDLAAGNGLVGLMVHSAITRWAFAPMSICVTRADEATLAAAERELSILARHPAPTGHALEAEALFVGAALGSEAAVLDQLPTDVTQLDAWVQAPTLLEAWELLMHDPASRRTYGDDYPADFARFASWAAHIESFDNEMIGVGGFGLQVRYLYRDAATRSAIRLLLAQVRVRALGEIDAEEPALLDAPELADLRTGRAFGWRLTDEGGELRSEDPFESDPEQRLDFVAQVPRPAPAVAQPDR